MAVVDAAEEDAGEGYFASVSDLMVGILFVFLLMLTVFAINFRTGEDGQKVERASYQAALERAELAEKRAKAETALAVERRTENERLKSLLRDAVAQLERDTQDRTEARTRLLASLEKTLNERGIGVTVEPKSGILRLSDDLLFDVGESRIPPEKGSTLATLAEVLAQILPCYGYGSKRANCDPNSIPILEAILVEGHTDRQGFARRALPAFPLAGETADRRGRLTDAESKARNDQLSTGRALAVFADLQRAQPSLGTLQNGDRLPLLGFSGYGQRRPLPDAQGDTEDQFRRNRRIDLRFVLSTRTSEELQRLREQIHDAAGKTP